MHSSSEAPSISMVLAIFVGLIPVNVPHGSSFFVSLESKQYSIHFAFVLVSFRSDNSHSHASSSNVPSCTSSIVIFFLVLSSSVKHCVSAQSFIHTRRNKSPSAHAYSFVSILLIARPG